MLQLTSDQLDELNFISNHICEHRSVWGGCMFETYGEELDFVRSVDPSRICTLIEGDDGEWYVVSGYHFVNRLGYLILESPLDYEFEAKYS
jgi:hypothetical protein